MLRRIVEIFTPAIVVFFITMYFGFVIGMGAMLIYFLVKFLYNYETYRRLPTATITFKDQSLNFKCIKSDYKGRKAFINLREILEKDEEIWFIKFIVSEITHQDSNSFEQSGGIIPTKLVLNSMEFNFHMDTKKQRCPCASVTPCWIAESYFGRSIESVDNKLWGIGVLLFKIEFPNQRRRRFMHKPTELKHLGNFEPVFNF